MKHLRGLNLCTTTFNEQEKRKLKALSSILLKARTFIRVVVTPKF